MPAKNSPIRLKYGINGSIVLGIAYRYDNKIANLIMGYGGQYHSIDCDQEWSVPGYACMQVRSPTRAGISRFIKSSGMATDGGKEARHSRSAFIDSPSKEFKSLRLALSLNPEYIGTNRPAAVISMHRRFGKPRQAIHTPSPSSMQILIDKNIPLAASAFRELGRVVLLDTPEFSNESVRHADILVIRSETKVDRKLLEGSRVRFVGTATIGTDHIDLPYLRANGINFASAPGSNANSVKEYVLGACLTLAQRKGFAFEKTTIGVVGVGNIGSKVVSLAKALGMNVLHNDPPLARLTGDPRFVPLDSLMDADIITLHVPLIRDGDDATVSLFNTKRIAAMKPGSMLINTSRGSVVGTEGLKEALRSGHLTAAVIDVWEREPIIDVDLLRVVSLASAHIAGYSMDGKVNAVSMIRAAIASFLHIDSPWDPTKEMPPPVSPRIVINSGLSLQGILLQSVRSCYDIEEDDRMLRELLKISEAKRGTYFHKLRSGYRVRREFANTTVELPPGQSDVAKLLNATGFKVHQ